MKSFQNSWVNIVRSWFSRPNIISQWVVSRHPSELCHSFRNLDIVMPLTVDLCYNVEDFWSRRRLVFAKITLVHIQCFQPNTFHYIYAYTNFTNNISCQFMPNQPCNTFENKYSSGIRIKHVQAIYQL